MSTVIYDDVYGARMTKVFGCSFKNISVQMGFDDTPTIFTLTIVEENDQDFTLDDSDVRSAQYVSFGELSMLGVVQSWEKSTIDPNGTGIYNVKLVDTKIVLSAAQVFMHEGQNWQLGQFSANQGVDPSVLGHDYEDDEVGPSGYLGSNIDYGPNIITIGSSDISDFDSGMPFSAIKDILENSTIYYGNDIYEIDLSELEILPYLDTGEGSPYRVDGSTRSITSIITEVCQAFGYQWFVESSRKSTTDNTIVIKIYVVNRICASDQTVAMDLDDLVSLHNGKILMRRDGYENRDDIARHVLVGGIRRTLTKFTGEQLLQFWGWDDNGEPLSQPSFTKYDEHYTRRTLTTISEMRSALNGGLEGSMDDDVLVRLKSYADEHFGRKFYIVMDGNNLDSNQNSWIETIPAGWWEGSNSPDVLHGDAEQEFSTEDGRWVAFVKLPSPRGRWGNAISQSKNIISYHGRLYMKASLEQFGRYVVVTLLSPMSISSDDESQLDRMTELDTAWIPLMDKRKFYGPWSSDANIPEAHRRYGKTTVEVDPDLVPWKFGYRGIAHACGMSDMNRVAEARVQERATMEQIINTGQLEVADVPKVNIGQEITDGSSITQIYVQFGERGITTRYVANLYTGDYLRRQEQKKISEVHMDYERSNAYKQPGNFPDLNEELKTLAVALEPEEDTLKGPSLEDMRYMWEIPQGGLGVIIAHDIGPHYSVRKLNVVDIDSYSFAAGMALNIPEWTNVRNLAEPDNSPGYLANGTQVTVSIFKVTEHGPYIPYIEQNPQTFAPPIV